MFKGDESEKREETEGVDEMTVSPESGHPVAGEDVGALEEGAGRAKAQATPPIDDKGQKKQQTAHSAPEEDVGAAPHQEAPDEESPSKT